MKKVLLLLLTGAMLLTACTSGEDGTGTSDDMGGTEQTDPGSNTLGDDDGDGVIEDGDDGGMMGGMMGDDNSDETGTGGGNSDIGGSTDNGSSGGMGSGENGSGNSGGSTNGSGNGSTNDSGSGNGNGSTGGNNGGGTTSGNGGSNGSGNGNNGSTGGSLNAGGNNSSFTEVDKVESADDAVNFIGANVYSRCPTVIPAMTETRVLSTEDKDAISFNTGLTDTSGIEDIILSESASNAVAYSFVMLRTDGTNTEELQRALGESVNPQKWSGVQAEKVASVVLDNDVILVMGSAEQVDTILNAVTSAAKDVYETVGSIVPVLS